MVVRHFNFKERTFLHLPAAIEGFEDEVIRYRNAVEPLLNEKHSDFQIIGNMSGDAYAGVFVFNKGWYFYRTFERDDSKIDLYGPYDTDTAIANTIVWEHLRGWEQYQVNAKNRCLKGPVSKRTLQST